MFLIIFTAGLVSIKILKLTNEWCSSTILLVWCIRWKYFWLLIVRTWKISSSWCYCAVLRIWGSQSALHHYFWLAWLHNQIKIGGLEHHCYYSVLTGFVVWFLIIRDWQLSSSWYFRINWKLGGYNWHCRMVGAHHYLTIR